MTAAMEAKKKIVFILSLVSSALEIDANGGFFFAASCSYIRLRYERKMMEVQSPFFAFTAADAFCWSFLNPYDICSLSCSPSLHPYDCRSSSSVRSFFILCVLSIRRNISSIMFAGEFQSIFFLSFCFNFLLTRWARPSQCRLGRRRNALVQKFSSMSAALMNVRFSLCGMKETSN